ncbi:MAG: DNA recombination protein RmuC [Chitinophagales bacterium]|nr:DNA recombination protein RmuC [Chitinophagales bacterium]
MRKNGQLQKEIQEYITEKATFKANSEQFLDAKTKLEDTVSRLRDEYLNSERQLISSHEENRFLREQMNYQKSELEQLQKRFKDEFEVLVQKILEEKSQKFTDKNQENISAILKPLKEKIQQFEEKVDNVNKEQINRNASLIEQVKQLSELNKLMSAETQNLTKALKMDTKMQGNWGEVILESILEKSGLRKDYEYFIQPSYAQDGGKSLRPDVVIQLPDNKSVIVDSKVSLVAYEQYCNTEDEKDKSQFLKAHIQSVRQHVKNLSSKEYQLIEQLQTPDFVLLFIPIEPAFHLAIHEDRQLFQDAYNQNIIIVSTSTLLATLRTISSIWKQEYQSRYAQDIAEHAGRLYDKFVGFVEEMDRLGKRIEQSQVSYQTAMNKLSVGNGNLIRSAQKLKDLGVKTGKQIPFHLTGSDEPEE